MQRGDDVAELQRRLGLLGFDAGRVDGIFGPRTDRALTDFQRNGGLITDSICGPSTLAALARLGDVGGDRGTPGGRASISAVRERERHRHRPRRWPDAPSPWVSPAGSTRWRHAVAAAISAAGGVAVVVATSGWFDPGGPGQRHRGRRLRRAVPRRRRPWLLVVVLPLPHRLRGPEGHRLAELVRAVLPGVVPAPRTAACGAWRCPCSARRGCRPSCRELGAPTVVVERTAELAAALTTALQHWAQPTPRL